MQWHCRLLYKSFLGVKVDDSNYGMNLKDNAVSKVLQGLGSLNLWRAIA
ncbi:hypothetical protein [Nostoc sp. UHCC 0252]|nr:hypothetical protein [Nostoc sp. UHCC 0252]MEA5605352.1 hypothetical protein [Nostoc sp. UHCC 0252]